MLTGDHLIAAAYVAVLGWLGYRAARSIVSLGDVKRGGLENLAGGRGAFSLEPDGEGGQVCIDNATNRIVADELCGLAGGNTAINR